MGLDLFMIVGPKDIREYQMSNGKVPFRLWLNSLRDIKGRAVVRARLDRLALGNFGDCESIGGGIHEVRIHFGPGYRIYFGQHGETLIILLCGGDKSTQSKDVRAAKEFWVDYWRRIHEET